jgi:DNA-binding NarL/FixJ family response regulator
MVQETVPEWALIVDDHPLFCDALELTLKAVSNVQNISAVGSMEAAIDALQMRSPPALIVLDLNLPDVDGLDGLIKLRSTARMCPIIVVSSMCDNSIVSGSLKAGANGFVPKHSRRAVFKEAIQAIAANEVYRPPGYVETSPRGDGQDVVERLASLTRQQSCILELICDGKLNKQIAYELSIAETTVKAHVTAIMRKLNVQSRTQAVLVAQKAKFSNVQSEPPL